MSPYVPLVVKRKADADSFVRQFRPRQRPLVIRCFEEGVLRNRTPHTSLAVYQVRTHALDLLCSDLQADRSLGIALLTQITRNGSGARALAEFMSIRNRLPCEHCSESQLELLRLFGYDFDSCSLEEAHDHLLGFLPGE